MAYNDSSFKFVKPEKGSAGLPLWVGNVLRYKCEGDENAESKTLHCYEP